jgi:integrase/recombinase XerD
MRAMLECLYSTGMRVSELVNINIADINFKENWIRVLGKGNKFRDVPIGPKAKEAIAAYLENRRERFDNCADNVFLNNRGKKLTRGGFWKQLRQLSLLGNITGRVYPHRIRHSTASHLLSNGVDIRVLQELLGHSSITTTQIYTHVTPALLKAKVESAHPRF